MCWLKMLKESQIYMYRLMQDNVMCMCVRLSTRKAIHRQVSHLRCNSLIYHSVPDSIRVTSLLLSPHTHTHTHTHTQRRGITTPIASALNSPKATFTSKQGLSDLTLEGRQQPALCFHLARRQ